MKFGRKLREQSREVFDDDVVDAAIDYKSLKQFIARIKKTDEAGEDSAAEREDWFEQFEAEVRKFDSFFKERVEETREEVERTEASAAEHSVRPAPSGQRNDVKDLYCRVQELKLFAELNRTGCRKILKKFDKNVEGGRASAKYQEWLLTLHVASLEPELADMSKRLVGAFSEMLEPSKRGNAKIAGMELDYHVTCVSDLFSHMQTHDGAPGAQQAVALSSSNSLTPSDPPSLGSPGHEE
eukprot:TRINITY_DN3604_c3_g2_i1.p1 TRINITY_DN3604_c3_g2~~TRINITY_DN3604_c3_g2_i1.p1  ORF type:complete len:240 (+),score=80.43 TRINITY_DN3604_c3_g2_i1:128-847(+)